MNISSATKTKLQIYINITIPQVLPNILSTMFGDTVTSSRPYKKPTRSGGWLKEKSLSSKVLPDGTLIDKILFNASPAGNLSNK